MDHQLYINVLWAPLCLNMFVDECEGIFGDLGILPVNVVEDFDFLFARPFRGLCITGKRPE